jgi:hypothetical protein
MNKYTVFLHSDIESNLSWYCVEAEDKYDAATIAANIYRVDAGITGPYPEIYTDLILSGFVDVLENYT